MLQVSRRTAEALERRGRRAPPAASGVFLESSPRVPVYEEELWTARQRQACSIHEVSYRACFKPQLPAYFIDRLSDDGDLVYDPFSGRGTTVVEAALRGRRVVANDISPLSAIFARPRLEVPHVSEVDARLSAIELGQRVRPALDLSMFFHADTEREILNLRAYLNARRRSRSEDAIDRWIRMVATNRLTGHSPGFFSVYTLPPNQAVSIEGQLKINQRLEQKPTYRNVRELILRKSIQLQAGLTANDRDRLRRAASHARFLEGSAASTRAIGHNSVQLTVTSPPFLDVVQYAKDNWLRCWFNGLDADDIGRRMTILRSVDEWAVAMQSVFAELYRITRPGGWVAFEVGEVRRAAVRLEEIVAPLGTAVGFECQAVLINAQRFTKTANIWGISNNRLGTNTNRIAIFRKPVPQR
jgi:SAM-dependent methyltransferase